MFGWRLLRIRGHSMDPLLRDGDYALARRLAPEQEIAVGDIVEIDHPDLGRIVKAIKEIGLGSVRVEGRALRSIGADQIGPMPRSRVAARLVWRISPGGVSRIRADSGDLIA